MRIMKIFKEKIIIAVLVLSAALRIFYLLGTEYNERTYDVTEGGGHLDYIRYLAENYKLPDPTSGWEYHQPPLYYISGAIVYKFSQTFHINFYKTLQILSFFYFYVFIVFGILILRNIIENKRLFYLSTAVLAFWPSGIIHSARIGNDAMLYAFYAACLYFILRWHKEKNVKLLYFSVFIFSAAILIKANAIALAGVIAVSVFLAFFQKYKLPFKHIIIVSFLIIFSILLSFAPKFYGHFKNNKNDWLVGGALQTMNRRLFVGNGFKNYAYFDANKFIKQPFTSSWEDWGGRQYFWNYLLKTSLFGEFSFNNNFQSSLGLVLSWTFLAVLFYGIIGFILGVKKNILIFFNALLLLFLIFLFKFKIPSSSNGDFRYIFPSLLSFISFNSYSLEYFKKTNTVIFYFGAVASVLFVLLSALFFILN